MIWDKVYPPENFRRSPLKVGWFPKRKANLFQANHHGELRGFHGFRFREGLSNGSMVVEMVPLKGGIGGIVHPPIGSIYHLYTTYILLPTTF